MSWLNPRRALSALRFLLVAGLLLGLTARAQPLQIPQFSTLPIEPGLRAEIELFFSRCGFLAPPLPGRPFALYDVVLSGLTPSGPFQRTGVLFLTGPITLVGTDNGINPNDLILLSGTPDTFPEPGAIRFATNSALTNLLQARCSQAAIDFAFVGADPVAGRLDIVPDINIAAAGPFNQFNLNGGLFANVLQIKDGLMQVFFLQDGTLLTGQIQFLGTGFIFPSTVLYQANIVGQLRGTGIF
ncbi:hypothetical protein [Archangium lansingense]|uniref:Choice-of-anchor A domain-containing protein n=1 Tax=Archangium lansingense TaxID=2995310 RepID=A0ABT4AGT5_9BACT|nr:hypothetical protein [Archangium lansinium]MCY1080881.1 hypothetical protein [Archangium lansinium]